MPDNDFNNLSTVKFQQKLKPAARSIYKSIFPGCEIRDLREDGFEVHVLDKNFGIDSIINTMLGQKITIQEKYRSNSALKYQDFTQEYLNAAGTPFESHGEWFNLTAQLYFYGWSNAMETDFEKWLILDVVKYKLMVEKAGGLQHLGRKHQNREHGSSVFYSIPLHKFAPAILFQHQILSEHLSTPNSNQNKTINERTVT